MDKRDIARALREIAEYLDLSEGNQFKSRAYANAARRVEGIEEPLETIVEEGRLTSLEGIGKATAAVIEELVRSGRSDYLDELRSKYPPGILELVRVPGLGMKKIKTLYETLGVSSVAGLKEAIAQNLLVDLAGFGAKTQEKIQGGIEFLEKNRQQFLLATVIPAAAEITERFTKIKEIVEVEVSGSVRRRLEVVRNINLCIATAKPKLLAGALQKLPLLTDVEEVEPSLWSATLRDAIPLLIRIVTPDEYPTRLLFDTGSDEFLQGIVRHAAKKKLQLTSAALLRGSENVVLSSERDIFDELSLPFIAPELRESFDPPKRKKELRLVSVSDLRGTFHMHSTWSDGRNSISEMLHAAKGRGFEYAGLSDHSKTASYAGGLTESQLVQQHAEIDSLRDEVKPLRVFRGTEADILGAGEIDYADDVLSNFDFVIASVHSKFRIPKDEMTARVVEALRNPFVTFLGHLTGRLLLSRDPYELDLDQVFDAAAENGVMIEINGDPRRLELDWRCLRRAVDRGVTFSIHPDAHSTDSIGYVVNGTWVARKGGLEPKHIFNTREVDEVEDYLLKRRKKAIAARSA